MVECPARKLSFSVVSNEKYQIYRFDKKCQIHYVSLQSEEGQAILERLKLDKTDFDSFVFVQGDDYWKKSTAALKLLQFFPFYMKVFYLGYIIPRFIRDYCYDFIASRRKSFAGASCRIGDEQFQKQIIS